ncbi:MAG: hypothetical protein DRJ52_05680 [Thermoprotei archaeon]|nr:MAG: hypothetical protein DRJ52_05680 [Thermoprotei archaeon]
MQVLEGKLAEIRAEMGAPPHVLEVKKTLTSYADLEERKVVLAESQLNMVEWVYRHELLHLKKWPRTPAKDLYWQAKVLSRLWGGFARELFLRKRREVMNIVYDALIDYSLRKYPAAVSEIRKYAEKLRGLPDLPPHEKARLLAAGLNEDRELRRELEEEDVVTLGVRATWWLLEHPEYSPEPDMRIEHTRRDFEEAAAEAIAEGDPETLGALKKIAEEEEIEFSEDRSALAALAKVYEWYLSVEESGRSGRGGRGTLALWSPGDDPSLLDMYTSLMCAPVAVLGLTTVKRSVRRERGTEPRGFRDVAILVDESCSMGTVEKEKAVRRIGVSLLAWLNRHGVQYQIIGFGSRAKTRVPLGFDYIAGVKYFLRYRGYQGNTLLAPAVRLVEGRDLLIYIISDAEIYDLSQLQDIEANLREVVLVLVSKTTGTLESYKRALGRITTKIYHVNPSLIDKWIIKEIKERTAEIKNN